MKKLIVFALAFLIQIVSAQNVILNKVVKSKTSTDKTFYKIDPEVITSEYLGELEVQGFSDDDVKMFDMIYKKAKEIGANAFSFQPFQNIDATVSKFDPIHYKFNLYFVENNQLQPENNVIYLIASPYKKQNIAVNKQNITFEPRTFKRQILTPGETYKISTKKLLGSSIQLKAQENQPAQYFQFSAFSVNSNPYGTAGINFKSGDITRLEQSYGQFLTTIYEEVK